MAILVNTLKSFLKENDFVYAHGNGESTLFKKAKKINIHPQYETVAFYCRYDDHYVHMGSFSLNEVFKDIDKKGLIYYFITTE